MYGIDVATYQRTLDMNTIRNAGNEFSGVKAVASNNRALARAADYENNVDRIMAAGLQKYPYTVPNSQNSPEATAAFTIANAYRRTPTDCWMLDNEPLDQFKVFWGDADSARYWREMQKLGVDLARGIQYCPAAATRAQGRWSQLIQLREEFGLQIQWVSYGDNDPYYEDGEEPFIGNTGLVNPESHQFTSSYSVPGYSGLIDRVYSRLTLSQMFGTTGGAGMPRTPQGAFAWALNEAKNGNVLKDWAGWCEKFINNAGAFNQAFASALLAGNASGPLRTDYGNAGVGAIIFWSGVGGFGHVAFVFEAGPDPLLLMASGSVDNPWGHNIGTIRLSRYQAKFGHPLRGWTYRHGTETLNLSGTAGDGTTPIDNSSKGDIMARYLWAPDRAGILVKGEVGGVYFPKNIEEAQSLKDVYNGVDVSTRQWDVARQASLNILADRGGELGELEASLDASFQELFKRIDAIDDDLTADVDEAALAAALGPILEKSGIEAKVDATKLAQVFLDGFATRVKE